MPCVSAEYVSNYVHALPPALRTLRHFYSLTERENQIQKSPKSEISLRALCDLCHEVVGNDVHGQEENSGNPSQRIRK